MILKFAADQHSSEAFCFHYQQNFHRDNQSFYIAIFKPFFTVRPHFLQAIVHSVDWTYEEMQFRSGKKPNYRCIIIIIIKCNRGMYHIPEMFRVFLFGPCVKIVPEKAHETRYGSWFTFLVEIIIIDVTPAAGMTTAVQYHAQQYITKFQVGSHRKSLSLPTAF